MILRKKSKQIFDRLLICYIRSICSSRNIFHFRFHEHDTGTQANAMDDYFCQNRYFYLSFTDAGKLLTLKCVTCRSNLQKIVFDKKSWV